MTAVFGDYLGKSAPAVGQLYPARCYTSSQFWKQNGCLCTRQTQWSSCTWKQQYSSSWGRVLMPRLAFTGNWTRVDRADRPQAGQQAAQHVPGWPQKWSSGSTQPLPKVAQPGLDFLPLGSDSEKTHWASCAKFLRSGLRQPVLPCSP